MSGYELDDQDSIPVCGHHSQAGSCALSSSLLIGSRDSSPVAARS